jgi:hypothetical protein
MSLVSGLLTHQCTVKSATFTNNERGGQTATLADVVTALPVLIDRLSERQVAANVGKVNVGTHRGYLDTEAVGVVLEGMVITDFAKIEDPTNVQKNADGTATQYRILDIHDPNNLGDHLELTLEKIAGRDAIPESA